ncbi:MAG: NYN domain-containing protein [Patescibacteria group bacterium]|nr:NYN domain-containing protein [Patescibacteria group bacterium]
MKCEENNYAYIDNTNLYKGCDAEGFKLDYVKFRKYLGEKHNIKVAYIFIGFVPGNEEMYEQFQKWGYTIIFKPTVPNEEKIKGNCDAEMVLYAVKDFYEKKYNKAILITSDGDFACLAKFLLKRDAIKVLLSPRSGRKCSSLLRKSGIKITFLRQVKSKIEYIRNEKLPLRTKP